MVSFDSLSVGKMLLRKGKFIAFFRISGLGLQIFLLALLAIFIMFLGRHGFVLANDIILIDEANDNANNYQNRQLAIIDYLIPGQRPQAPVDDDIEIKDIGAEEIELLEESPEQNSIEDANYSDAMESTNYIPELIMDNYSEEADGAPPAINIGTPLWGIDLRQRQYAPEVPLNANPNSRLYKIYNDPKFMDVVNMFDERHLIEEERVKFLAGDYFVRARIVYAFIVDYIYYNLSYEEQSTFISLSQDGKDGFIYEYFKDNVDYSGMLRPELLFAQREQSDRQEGKKPFYIISDDQQNYINCKVTPYLKEADFYMPREFSRGNDLTRVPGSFLFAEGEVIQISGQVLDINCLPMSNVAVSLWQADNYGVFQREREAYLKLTQREKNLITFRYDPNFISTGNSVTDNYGKFSFLTIKPKGKPTIDSYVAPKLYLRVANDKNTLNMVAFFPEFANLNRQDPLYSSLSENNQSLITLVPTKCDSMMPCSGRSIYRHTVVLNEVASFYSD